MPRQPRLEAPGLLYHIIARGIERREIFRDHSDYQFFLDRLGKILIDSGTKCFAFALIPNHFHLLLYSSTIPVSSVMRRLLTGYAIYFNKRHKRAGHLFQNRYKSIICQEDPYLLELVRYIHLNPIRAGISKTLVELNNYPYSGHSALLGRVNYNWYDAGDVLTLFGKQKNRATNKYLEFIKDGLSMGKDIRFSGGGLKRSLNFPNNYPKEKQAFDDRILGESDYVLSLQESAEKTVPISSGTPINEVIEKEIKSHGITYEQLMGGGKSAAINAARTIIVYKAVTKLGFSFAKTARYLNVHRSTVARLVERAKDSADTGREGNR